MGQETRVHEVIPWFFNQLLSTPRLWATVRKFVKLSQEQFGREIGVSRQSISSWETEMAIPTRAHTVRAQAVLEKHLKVTLEDMSGRQRLKLLLDGDED